MATPDTLEKYAETIGIELNQTEVDKVNARLEDMIRNIDLYFGSGGSLVQVWKVYGCIAVRFVTKVKSYLVSYIKLIDP